MTDQNRPVDRVLWALQERAKELNCLYLVEELLRDPDRSLETVFEGMIAAIPSGWQYPDLCQVKITCDGRTFAPASFRETPWVQTAEIVINDERVGSVSVSYTSDVPGSEQGPFLKEEGRLIRTIADRVAHFIQFQRLRQMRREFRSAEHDLAERGQDDWQIVLGLLRRTDHDLYRRLLRKLFVRLRASGIREAEDLHDALRTETGPEDDNRPTRKNAFDLGTRIESEIFAIAVRYFTGEEILSWVQKWIQDDRTSFLLSAVGNVAAPLSTVADAIRRFHHMQAEGVELSPTTDQEVRVSLIQRFFTDEIDYVNVACDYLDIADFNDLVQRVIAPANSLGRLGGKSAGLFLAAHILAKAGKEHEVLRSVQTPRTWYLSSDAILSFLAYNDLEELVEHKYKDIGEIRREYDQIVHVFKQSSFPPEIVRGVSMALDEFEDRPLIVRSSSLLEDRFGAAFSGKYKSLFLANQGSKPERLTALLDAIAEVYASVFGPDPIQYRLERGLLHVREEMGIMIQEVVGTRIGRYLLPAFAGVAFSRNEFRWSPRIRREDGLVRMVPGLGTRAVDRMSDDYPVLVSPGQPGLRANVTADDVMRYSPRKLDVINLETNTFESIDAQRFFKDHAAAIPWLREAISVLRDDHLRAPGLLDTVLHDGEFCVTFEGLIARSAFVERVHTMLRVLEARLGRPVDLEFASNGRDLYLVQCRPQSYSPESAPAPIPKDVPREDLLFSANRSVSNGTVPDITHIVYVDPSRYAQLDDMGTLKDVGRAVSQLNKELPKRHFILMGPGRWGSRGDIRLGVSVTYSDISNAAMLVEIARQRGNYVPELSFGTHFFQDLVESGIRYLPLYPDEAGVIFNEAFFTRAPSVFVQLVPDLAHLDGVIRVIDVASTCDGRALQVLMNAELDEAIGIVARTAEPTASRPRVGASTAGAASEEHWRWRLHMAERMAAQLDAERYGVKALYVFGSVKNATAGPGSDLDLIVHVAGTQAQQRALTEWLEGWSLCLDEMNFLRTGYRSGNLLDVHFVTDADIAARGPFAAKIGAVTDAARQLPLKQSGGAATP